MAERCRCDIRACLNTLQLLARQRAARRGGGVGGGGGGGGFGGGRAGGGRITAWQVREGPRAAAAGRPSSHCKPAAAQQRATAEAEADLVAGYNVE
jgi:hypothetical protein